MHKYNREEGIAIEINYNLPMIEDNSLLETNLARRLTRFIKVIKELYIFNNLLSETFKVYLFVLISKPKCSIIFVGIQ